MNNTVEMVAIGDDTLEALRGEDGTVLVVVRRICEALGIDHKSQREKLKEKPWARGGIITSRDAAGRLQDLFVIPLDSVPMWLATIERVSPELQAKLARFQVEARDVLAAHFLGSPRPSSRPSGGTRPSGSALDMLTMIDTMSAAVRATLAEVDQVRALALDARAAAEDAAKALDRATREGMQYREQRRRIDAAVGHVTRAIRRHCAERAIDYRTIYSVVRSELGLRRTQDGGPALGKAKLRADQALRLARCATGLGVPGCSQIVIESILDGTDDPTRAGAIDVEPTPTSRPAWLPAWTGPAVPPRGGAQ